MMVPFDAILLILFIITAIIIIVLGIVTGIIIYLAYKQMVMEHTRDMKEYRGGI